MIGLILKILTFPLRLIFGGRKSSPFGGMLKLVLILVVVAVLLKSCTGIRSTSSKQLNVNRGEVQGNTSLVVVTPPDIGRPRYHTSEQNVAPLKISTQSGCNYFVVLRDYKTKMPKVDVFLQGGQDSEFNVPAGEFEIEYSAGINWYGDENLFGPETQTAKASGVATFKNGIGMSLDLRRTR